MKVEALTDQYPSGLVDADRAASEVHISAERLTALADGLFAPHYRIDNGAPLFRVPELKRWAAVNLLSRVEGRDLPEPIKIGAGLREKNARKVPVELAEVERLYDITGEYRRTGIYFLCLENKIQYIGQAKCAASRIKSHLKDKVFDQVLFLPWPGDDLDRIEGALIRHFKPPLNGRLGPNKTLVAPGVFTTDEAALKEVFDE